MRDLRWMDRAACRGRPVERWFDHYQHPALKICGGCPVTSECLATALSRDAEGRVYGAYGIWGGLGEKHRAKLQSVNQQVQG